MNYFYGFIILGIVGGLTFFTWGLCRISAQSDQYVERMHQERLQDGPR